MRTVTVCSSTFAPLGRAQAAALGDPDPGIAVVPHPFGLNTRERILALADRCAADIAALVERPATGIKPAASAEALPATHTIEGDAASINAYCRERGWTDGLPVIPPTVESVRSMVAGAGCRGDEVIARIAPGFGEATVERIAVNAVMAGCAPGHMPVLIAAVRAIASPEFNLQGIQSTTNPVAVWLIVNGPIAAALGMNAGMNCLGQGNWANAAIGRALHLVMQNVGDARPGVMDRATHGQPGKYSFCCAENEAESPWAPLHVERGYSATDSAVTVVAAEGTINMNTHTKDARSLIRIMVETMKHPPSNEYCLGTGEPWIVMGPEHAQILADAGWSKDDVRKLLWEGSRIPASDMADRDLLRTKNTRRQELGEVTDATLLPIAKDASLIGLLVAGGPGTHSVYVPSFGVGRSVTMAIR